MSSTHKFKYAQHHIFNFSKILFSLSSSPHQGIGNRYTWYPGLGTDHRSSSFSSWKASFSTKTSSAALEVSFILTTTNFSLKFLTEYCRPDNDLLLQAPGLFCKSTLESQKHWVTKTRLKKFSPRPRGKSVIGEILFECMIKVAKDFFKDLCWMKFIFE